MWHISSHCFAWQEKLRTGQYSDLAGVESDLKRMVNNAKTYNEKGSDIYDDAERLRKTASNWMTRFNPAYRDPKYVAQPTPLPEGTTNGVRNDSNDKSKRAAVSTPQQSAKTRASNSAGLDGTEDSDFTGKSFQQAQDQIISELMDYRDAEWDSRPIYTPHVHYANSLLQQST